MTISLKHVKLQFNTLQNQGNHKSEANSGLTKAKKKGTQAQC